MRKLFLLMLACMGIGGTAVKAAPGAPVMRNLVVFVAFQDDPQAPFVHDAAHYDKLFNAEIEGYKSVYSYFLHSSYGHLHWKSDFYPTATDGNINFIRTSQPRRYYQPKSSSNPNGYATDIEAAAREQALVKEVALQLATKLPENQDVDANADGQVDNMVLVFGGISDRRGTNLLWPKRSNFLLSATEPVKLNGKTLTSYIMVFDKSNGYKLFGGNIPINTGVLCHEMSHSLGTYDLYHPSSDNLNPVWRWDLMSDDEPDAQQMLVYTKWRYCQWVDSIPTISKPGVYTLNPNGGTTKENVAYKIQPTGSDEYFVVEYRRKEGYDASIPASGMLIYRINPRFRGNISYDGVTRFDETYIFRPNGTTKEGGTVGNAVFSSDYGRSAFGVDPAFAPFYSDGSMAALTIDSIGTCGETISFRLRESVKRIYVKDTQLDLAGGNAAQAVIGFHADQTWAVEGVPSWLTLSVTEGEKGAQNITVTTTEANATAGSRSATLVFVGKQDGRQKDTIVVSQASDVIQKPLKPAATTVGGTVQLSWTAPLEGTPMMTQDFEADNSLDGWVVENSDDRGWAHKSKGKNPLVKLDQPHAGNRFAGMLYAMTDASQDEKLISPVLRNAKTLAFWSASTAPLNKATRPDAAMNFYRYKVEVTNDGGQTWHEVYDLMKQGTVTNRYEQVVLDLSAYQAENMQVRFHVWDENVQGVSYWWNVDDIAVYGQNDNSIVTGYDVYRNGEKIATVTEPRYTDNAPVQGDNTYSIVVRTTAGETDRSDEAVVKAETIALGITSTPAASTEPVVSVTRGQLTVTAPGGLASVHLYRLDGSLMASQQHAGTRAVFAVPSTGMVVVKTVMADGSVNSQKVLVKE